MAGSRNLSGLTVFVGPDMLPGMILLWSGSVVSIPTGFALCDGNNGTPNLRNKFILGAGDTYTPGAAGGVLEHEHTIDACSTVLATGADILVGEGILSDLAEDHNHGGSTNHTEVLPPYYALCYIMKL